MKKVYLLFMYLFLIQPTFAQSTNICALDSDRLGQINQTLNDLLNLTARQQILIMQLNQKAFNNFCTLRSKYDSPKEAPQAATLLDRKKWAIGIDRNTKLMELLSTQQRDIFTNLINSSASLFYKNDIFYRRTGKSIDEFVNSSRFLPESESIIRVIHSF